MTISDAIKDKLSFTNCSNVHHKGKVSFNLGVPISGAYEAVKINKHALFLTCNLQKNSTNDTC